MNIGCRLCKQQRKLCRSHIIPEWAYRPVYGQDSSAFVLSSETRRRRKVQHGLRKRLLCGECEDFFNRQFDQPFLRHWDAPSRLTLSTDQLFVRVVGIDYESTWKFLLSVLWRAHIASGEVLSAVDLGPHADRMLSILRAEKGAGVGEGYPTFCYALRDPDTGDLARQFVLTPVRKRTHGQWNYEMAFLGFAWKIFVSQSEPPLPVSCRLKRDGTIVMPVVSFREFGPIRRVLKLHAAGEPATKSE